MTTKQKAERRACSPGAQRNPGQVDPHTKTPDFAALHPGYEGARNDVASKKPAVPQDGGLVSPALIRPLTRPHGR